MSAERLVLSRKYKAFLKCNAPVEFLEGTTAAGKTTVGLFKFMCKVAESPKKLHILAAKDTGTAEKNIINKDLGIVDDFGILVQYNGNGTKDDKIPHILFRTSRGNKIIYVMGYGDKKKWQKALGGQYGCLYIDEINTADIDFVREASMRCDYLIGDNRHQGEVVAPENKLKEMAMAAVQAAGSGVSRDELESIINRAVMRIVAALADMGFYIDSEQIGRATSAARTAADRRFNAVEVG